MGLGSHANAKLAHTIVEKDMDEPSGWRYLDAGSTRTALLGPDGYVYKVPHPGYSWVNADEVSAARRWRNNKKLEMLDVRIPRVRKYNLGKDKDGETLYVNCMEFIESTIQVECNSEFDKECNCRHWGQRRICFGLLYERLVSHGFIDMFYANVHYGKDGKFYIIDLGAE